MKALLDTNIIIYRERNQILNMSIGNLFYWLDKLKVTKVIHPLSRIEINKYGDEKQKQIYLMKIESYENMKFSSEPTSDFLDMIKNLTSNEHDVIDNTLLFEVYQDKVDLLISEDRKIHLKAKILGIENKVFSISSYISKCVSENPELINYKALAISKEYFGNVDRTDHFFDSFREYYKEFDTWFLRKSDELSYICRDENNNIIGFLYLKIEGLNENYDDISPTFSYKKRLKIGTFKANATGFRLGERFIKIMFDNAIQYGVDEIYVTLFEKRDELEALKKLFYNWGFQKWGTKLSANGQENVLVKSMNVFLTNKTIKENFPNLTNNCNKYIMPIFAKFHTDLFPDSILRNEKRENYVKNIAHRYALQKVYISWADSSELKTGDVLLFYRTGTIFPKRYSSVITTVGVVSEVKRGFSNKDDFMNQCQNRSVFCENELSNFWEKHRYNMCIIKFIYVKSLNRKVTLQQLYDLEIIEVNNGPRPFTKLTDHQFNDIIIASKTSVTFKDIR